MLLWCSRPWKWKTKWVTGLRITMSSKWMDSTEHRLKENLTNKACCVIVMLKYINNWLWPCYIWRVSTLLIYILQVKWQQLWWWLVCDDDSAGRILTDITDSAGGTERMSPSASVCWLSWEPTERPAVAAAQNHLVATLRITPSQPDHRETLTPPQYTFYNQDLSPICRSARIILI